MNVLLQQIKSIREGSGVNQKQFAKQIGVSHTYYNALEKGRKKITIDILERIAKSTNTQLVITFIGKS